MKDKIAPRSVRPTVLFDGGCPLCNREIAHYRKIAGSAAIDWVDLNRIKRETVIDGIDRQAAMERFHFRDGSGRWHTGAFGFVELWRHLRYYRVVGEFLRFSRLARPLDMAYTRFARWRLARRCDSSRCSATLSPDRREPARSRHSQSTNAIDASTSTSVSGD
jgi:predicted DCC family thiol-disulfide oxidoreductase YuxK